LRRRATAVNGGGKRFLGTSQITVPKQIAVALIVFILLRLASAATRSKASLLTFVRLVRTNLMHAAAAGRPREATATTNPRLTPARVQPVPNRTAVRQVRG